VADAARALATGKATPSGFTAGITTQITGEKQMAASTLTTEAAGSVVINRRPDAPDAGHAHRCDDVPPSAQHVSADIYVLSDTIYVNMIMPGIGEQWMKAPRTEANLDAFDIQPVDSNWRPSMRRRTWR
jgi:hypothetical protein